jgi:ABC-type lipoprotein release transport system permease subunit
MDKEKSLSLSLMLAWRNVWKNKRRTVLTLLTTFVGCVMIIFFNAFAKGGHDQMIEDTVSRNAGHIQVQAKGFWENKGIEDAFIPDEKLMKAIENDRDIAGYSERIHAGGLMSFKDTTSGVMVQGIDPDKDKSVSNIYKSILPGGRFLKSDDSRHIIIGETLAKNIGAKTGDKTALISQGFDGSIAAEHLTIVGIFKTGTLEYDSALIIMPIKQAADTFSMTDFINSITIRVKKIDACYEVRDRLLGNVDRKKIDVLGWKELMPDIVQFIIMDDISAYIFDFILFMIVAFAVLNTIQMSVFERIREFGVMLALGTRPGQITAIILVESLIISLLGVFFGSIGGGLLSWYFFINPLNYGAYSKEMAAIGMNTTIMPADMTMLNLSVTVILTVALSVLFSIIPARKASKLNPVEAIRHL